MGDQTKASKVRVKKIHASIVPKDASIRRIHFHDEGQDFLYWDIDSSDEIIGCGPFQASVWVGNKLTGGQELKPDGFVKFWSNLMNQELIINYPIDRIEILSGEEVDNG